MSLEFACFWFWMLERILRLEMFFVFVLFISFYWGGPSPSVEGPCIHHGLLFLDVSWTSKVDISCTIFSCLHPRKFCPYQEVFCATTVISPPYYTGILLRGYVCAHVRCISTSFSGLYGAPLAWFDILFNTTLLAACDRNKRCTFQRLRFSSVKFTFGSSFPWFFIEE